MRRVQASGGAVLLFTLLFSLAAGAVVNNPGRTHRVFFANTDHELHVYHITGREPGATMIIIGGMHGNEPGGYLAADMYADLTLRKGNLIVVPRANIYSIFQNTRGTGGDLNRQFGSGEEHAVEREIASVLEGLMSESDVLLNLHDGSGFYSPQWVDSRHNPRLWGQSVIIDIDRFDRPDSEPCDLLSAAQRAVERVNGQIGNAEHHFRIKNTRTFDATTEHGEQRGSATFYAVNSVGIPAFGVETSQDIREESLRVEYQVLVVNAFLEEFGIEPDHPRFALETPALRFLAVSIDGGPSVLVENGESLGVVPGSTVEITHVEANYERGLIVDIEGVNGFNDFGRAVILRRDARVSVHKDKYPCGSIMLRADPAARDAAPGVRREERGPGVNIDAFRVSVNGKWTYLAPEETLEVLWGDELQLDDPLASTDEGYKINFRGFVGNQTSNDGEDRGYTIYTAHDLLQRFSLSPDSERYEIRAELGGRIFASSYVEIVEPELEYMLIRCGRGPALALADGDTLKVAPTDVLRILDVVTVPRESEPLTVNFRGFAGAGDAEDRGMDIRPGRDLIQTYSLEGRGRLYEITVRRKGLLIGRIVVLLDGGGGL